MGGRVCMWKVSYFTFAKFRMLGHLCKRNFRFTYYFSHESTLGEQSWYVACTKYIQVLHLTLSSTQANSILPPPLVVSSPLCSKTPRSASFCQRPRCLGPRGAGSVRGPKTFRWIRSPSGSHPSTTQRHSDDRKMSDCNKISINRYTV